MAADAITVTQASAALVTGTPAQGAQGQVVWPATPGYQPVQIMVTSTAGAQSAAVYLMTIWTGAIGAPAAAATTAWPVPAGKTLRINNAQAVVNSSAVTGGTVQFYLCAAGTTASHVSASVSTQLQVMKLQVLVSAGPVAASVMALQGQDVGAGTIVAMFGVGSTAYVINQVVMTGYLF